MWQAPNPSERYPKVKRAKKKWERSDSNIAITPPRLLKQSPAIYTCHQNGLETPSPRAPSAESASRQYCRPPHTLVAGLPSTSKKISSIVHLVDAVLRLSAGQTQGLVGQQLPTAGVDRSTDGDADY